MILRELRKEVGLSQKEFAQKFNLTQATISDWEIGKVEPSITWLIKLADYFEVSIDYLVGHTDDTGVIQNNSPALTIIEQEVVDCMRNVGDMEREIITDTAKNVYKAYKSNKSKTSKYSL